MRPLPGSAASRPGPVRRRRHIRQRAGGCNRARRLRGWPSTPPASPRHRPVRRSAAGAAGWRHRNAQWRGSAAGWPCPRPGRRPGSCPGRWHLRRSRARRRRSGTQSPAACRSRTGTAAPAHPRPRPVRPGACRRQTAPRSCARSRAGTRLHRCRGCVHARAAALRLRRCGWWCRPGSALLPCGPVRPSVGSCANTGNRPPARWARCPIAHWRCCGRGAGLIRPPRRHAAAWRYG